MNKCPVYLNATSISEYLKDWFQPTYSTPDFYSVCSKTGAGVPNNFFGNQSPHGGDSYAGLYIHSSLKGYYEYLAVKLNSPLEKGKKYKLEFFASLTERSGLAATVQAFVTDSIINQKTNYMGLLTNTPQLSSVGVVSDKVNWVRVFGDFIAEGGEKYLIIGAFEGNLTKGLHSSNHDAYYYIDDVSLQEDKTTIIAPEKSSDSLNIEKPVVLKRVIFATNRSELLPGSSGELDSISGYLRDNPKFNIEISGFTDNRGEEKKNLELSESRSKVVAEYLISKGIGSDRIKYKGYGSSRPITTNDTEEGRQQNRRVEFVISKK